MAGREIQTHSSGRLTPMPDLRLETTLTLAATRLLLLHFIRSGTGTPDEEAQCIAALGAIVIELRMRAEAVMLN